MVLSNSEAKKLGNELDENALAAHVVLQFLRRSIIFSRINRTAARKCQPQYRFRSPILEWTRGAGSPAVPIVSYVTYVTGDELLRLLELLFRSSGVTIFEHLEPLFEPNPHYWDHFRGPKTGGTDNARTDARTNGHTHIDSFGALHNRPCGQ